ncbi:PqqD family protein [Streptomyces sp. NPDC012769]|uniref:PqqD family protein n=1 Tax=Streptomyces sp. NPDC012769 TaxID=3364848 RepID=UPI00368BE183
MTTEQTAVPLTETSVPSRRLDARTRRTRSGMLIAGPDQAFELTETAAEIWTLLDGRRTVAEIGRKLAETYDIDAETATNDVLEILETLAGSQVITVTA